MTPNQLVNMLLQLSRDKPNNMEFGGLTRQLLLKYEQQHTMDDQ
jgi:hypothetical protein